MNKVALEMKAWKEQPIVSVELMSHLGGGYSKRVRVETNVLTKEVKFTVIDKLENSKTYFGTLESAIEAFEKIPKRY